MEIKGASPRTLSWTLYSPGEKKKKKRRASGLCRSLGPEMRDWTLLGSVDIEPKERLRTKDGSRQVPPTGQGKVTSEIITLKIRTKKKTRGKTYKRKPQGFVEEGRGH